MIILTPHEFKLLKRTIEIYKYSNTPEADVIKEIRQSMLTVNEQKTFTATVRELGIL